MKNTLLAGVASLSLALVLAAPAAMAEKGARAGEEGGKRHHKGKHGQMEARKIVMDYMIQAGDIDQAEVDEMRAQHEANREELKALKESGDEQGFDERKAELRAVAEERKDEIKAYIESHEDLQQQLAELRETMKAKHRERKQKKNEEA